MLNIYFGDMEEAIIIRLFILKIFIRIVGLQTSVQKR